MRALPVQEQVGFHRGRVVPESVSQRLVEGAFPVSAGAGKDGQYVFDNQSEQPDTYQSLHELPYLGIG